MTAIELTWEEDLAVLTIDTPACPVNIFTQAAAEDLLRLLPETESARAILFRSAKPRSFVNGVGLMMASATRGADDVRRLTRDVRGAFAALRASPVPTIAALRGSTYGCGLELSLHCDYRVAADVFDTELYMTELAEYLMIPAFGSTQDLPALVGLETATELLLWGERLRPQAALARGLVDAVFAGDDFEAGARAFARSASVHSRPPRAPASPGFVAAVRRRVAALPPAMVPAYSRALELMVSASTASAPDYEAEIEGCGESLAAPGAKAALSFFFVRQLAEKTALRGYATPDTIDVTLHGQALSALAADWRSRKLAHADLSPPPGKSAARLDFQPRGAARAGEVEIELALVPGLTVRSAALAYAPIRDSRFVEVIAKDVATAQATHHFLALAGYAPVLTRESDEPLTHALLAALLDPPLRFLARGGTPADVEATLRDFGFATSLGALLRALPHDALATLLPYGARSRERLHALALHEGPGGVPSEELSSAVHLSLLAAAISSIRRGQVPHVTIVDVAARELLGFPVSRGALCRSLTKAETERALHALGDTSSLLGIPARETLRQFVREGRPLY